MLDYRQTMGNNTINILDVTPLEFTYSSQIDAGIIIALFAIIISIVTLRRDRRDRQYENLHNTLNIITSINFKITDLVTTKKLTKTKGLQLKILAKELGNTYNYLAFLVNRKQINDKELYDIEHNFIFKFFEDYDKKKWINKEEHKECDLRSK